METKLFAPEEYWFYKDKHPDLLDDMVNGCGPDGWLCAVVPDHIFGLCVTEACDIHDWMYIMGETERDREKADRVLRNNMFRLVEAHTKYRLVKWLRNKAVRIYYQAVKDLGAPYYWNSKNPEHTMQLV